MVTKQYPHSISIVWNDKPTQNGDGDIVQGTERTFYSDCRAEPNGKGATSTSPDGTLINYSYTVYMPKGVNAIEIIPVGASVSLSLYGRVVLCKVKRFDRNFFNAKLWL